MEARRNSARKEFNASVKKNVMRARHAGHRGISHGDGDAMVRQCFVGHASATPGEGRTGLG